VKITIPYSGYWPYVRRGVERYLHDLTTFLAARGHQVHVITSTPGRSREAWDGGVRVTYLSQANHPLMYGYAYWVRAYIWAAVATRRLIEDRPDLIYLWTYSGIGWPRLFQDHFQLRYLYHVSVYWPRGAGRKMFPELTRAERVLALSQGAARDIEQEFKVSCDVLPPPVNMRTFRPSAPRNKTNPIVFFGADLSDPRKGGKLLLRAWNRVHRLRPTARLVLGGPPGVAGWLQDQNGEALPSQLHLVRDPAARAAIEVRGPGRLSDLPSWYSEASVTVLPSIWEMFGMVLTESLACGTPVVASRHHGPGEIIGDPGIGVTVDLKENADLESGEKANELADAILQGIELGSRPGTDARCREWANQWSLDRIGPLAEQFFEQAASRGAGDERGARPFAAAS